MTHTEILEEIYQVSLNGTKPNFVKELIYKQMEAGEAEDVHCKVAEVASTLISQREKEAVEKVIKKIGRNEGWEESTKYYLNKYLLGWSQK